MPHKLFKILLFIFLLSLLYAYGKSVHLLASQHINTDIMLTYLSGKMLNAHMPGYHFSQEYLATHDVKVNLIPNLSPPFSIMIAALIARYVSYQSFFVAFIGISLLLNIWGIIRLYQHFYGHRKTYSPWMLLAFVLANLVYMPTYMNTTFGQVALIFNAVVIAVYLSLDKKRPIRAGFLLALAVNIKIFFGIFLVYFLAKKQYKTFFSFLLFSLLFAALPLLFYGKSIYLEYWHVLNHVEWYGVNWNASWYGFFSRILGETSHRFHSAFYYPKLSKLLYYLVFICYTALIIYFARKNKSSDLTFAFTLSSMLLISPLGWSYYFPILITALLINIIAAESHQHYILLLCLLLFSIFLSALPYPLYRDTKTSSLILISQGNSAFFSLLLFNIINFLQLILPASENKAALLSKKFKLLVCFICLVPSLIGMISVTVALSSNKLPDKEASALAGISDLLPSNF